MILKEKLCKFYLRPGSRLDRRALNQGGFSIVEVLVVSLIVICFLAVAVPAVRGFNNPLRRSASELLGFVKITQAKAIASTYAYMIRPDSVGQVSARFGKNCIVDQFSADPKMILELPNGASFANSNWEVCFDARGRADSSLTITLVDTELKTADVEIFRGGAARIVYE